MSAPLEHWKVLPHGALTAVDDNVWTVTGTIHMPVGDFERRMTVVRLRNGGLVVYSAIALDEDEMARLDAFGPLAWLVVPGDDHRLDAKIWLQRYPSTHVAAPAGARNKALEVVPVESTSPDFGDTNVRWVTVPGTREHEAALVVRGAKGTTLVINDLIANLRREHGFTGWMLRLMGFAGDEPNIPGVRRLAMVKDSNALADQLLAWSEIGDLHCILVSHGEPIVDDPRGELRRLSESLR
ncbi:MAG: DUF4336 domain-containing protein [Pseudomonadota bacterium]|nr:DUF4336 domain-containing protein [Pseudomonadota bacterium]